MALLIYGPRASRSELTHHYVIASFYGERVCHVHDFLDISFGFIQATARTMIFEYYSAVSEARHRLRDPESAVMFMSFLELHRPLFPQKQKQKPSLSTRFYLPPFDWCPIHMWSYEAQVRLRVYGVDFTHQKGSCPILKVTMVPS